MTTPFYCLKAFHRLVQRLKREFPKLPLTLLLDRLYDNGPVMKTCLTNKRQLIIVLKDKSLPTVWQEAKGLLRLDTEGECRHIREWKRRRQVFRWANGIEYSYEIVSRAKTLGAHLVICEETWEENDINGNFVRQVWLSPCPT